jgi:hypothetical protein
VEIKLHNPSPTEIGSRATADVRGTFFGKAKLFSYHVERARKAPRRIENGIWPFVE